MEEKWVQLRKEWEQIYRNGGPTESEVPDGMLLNEIRSRMEGMCRHPDEVHNLPEKVDDRYMARDNEILCQAEMTLQVSGRWIGRTADISADKEMGFQSPYVRKNLEAAVKKKDLPAVRRLTEILEGQMEAEQRFWDKTCEKEWKKRKRKMDEAQVEGQMSFFDLIKGRRKQGNGCQGCI